MNQSERTENMNSEALYSQGICPKCEKKMYEDLWELKNNNS